MLQNASLQHKKEYRSVQILTVAYSLGASLHAYSPKQHVLVVLQQAVVSPCHAQCETASAWQEVSMALPTRSSMSQPLQPGGEIILKRKQDVFDAPDFQPIQFINSLYPDESSLTDLDKFIAVLKKQITAIDKEIFQAVRAQGGAHTRARQELQSAQQQILELTERIQAIQHKADESENMVQDICKDIRKLDYAKEHLTTGITALRRLAMLTVAVADLEASAGRRDQYKKSANLLEAAHQFIENFQQYADIPKVKNLATRLAQTEARLTQDVLEDFKALLGTVDIKVSAENLDRLADGCLVVDALGPRVRDQLLDWLCDREMNIYQLFSSSGGADVSKLDRFDRRFHWFRTRMEERKAEWLVFPEQWRVPQVLCLMFCKITKAHLKRVLSDDESAQGGLRTDIGPLIKAVVATNKFERDMAAVFGGGTDIEDEEGSDQQPGDEVTASEARKRLERLRHKQKQQEAQRQMDQLGEKARAEREAVRTTFEGAISEAFESSLHLYVAEEEKELMAYLEGLLREESEHHWKPTDEEVEARILPSANKLFLKVRSSLTRCVKMISRGPTLLSLSKVFQQVLSTYCQALHHRLPKTANGQTSVPQPFQGTEWYVRMPEDEERVVCHILHTSDFCCDTLDALASACQKDIKPALAEQVDMSEEQSAFQNLGGACMSVLALGINTRLDAALQELQRVRWDIVDNPGDDSVYVNTIRKVLLEVAPRLGQLLEVTPLSFLADKVVRTFVSRFQEAVGKCKRISDKGTLQLSIDCDAVRRVLHEFPKAAMAVKPKEDSHHADLVALPGQSSEDIEDDSHGPFAGYHAYVEREMGTLINMVKVLQSKPENLVDTFLLLMPAHHQNINEFARVCDMKGLSRQQQQQLFGAYQLKTSGAVDPAASAALSSAAGSGLAANLGAFKINMNNITSLASNISFPKMGTGGPSSPSGATRGLFARTLNSSSGSSTPGHQRGTSISTAAESMANKTKDTFAKVGTFMGTGFSKIGTAFTQTQDAPGQH